MNDDEPFIEIPSQGPASEITPPLKNLRDCFAEILDRVRPHSGDDRSCADFEQSVVRLQKSAEEIYSSMPAEVADQFAVEMRDYLESHLPAVAAGSGESAGDNGRHAQTRG